MIFLHKKTSHKTTAEKYIPPVHFMRACSYLCQRDATSRPQSRLSFSEQLPVSPTLYAVMSTLIILKLFLPIHYITQKLRVQ